MTKIKTQSPVTSQRYEIPPYTEASQGTRGAAGTCGTLKEQVVTEAKSSIGVQLRWSEPASGLKARAAVVITRSVPTGQNAPISSSPSAEPLHDDTSTTVANRSRTKIHAENRAVRLDTPARLRPVSSSPVEPETVRAPGHEPES